MRRGNWDGATAQFVRGDDYIWTISRLPLIYVRGLCAGATVVDYQFHCKPGPELVGFARPAFEGTLGTIEQSYRELGIKHLMLSPPVDNCRNVILEYVIDHHFGRHRSAWVGCYCRLCRCLRQYDGAADWGRFFMGGDPHHYANGPRCVCECGLN